MNRHSRDEGCRRCLKECGDVPRRAIEVQEGGNTANACVGRRTARSATGKGGSTRSRRDTTRPSGGLRRDLSWAQRTAKEVVGVAASVDRARSEGREESEWARRTNYDGWDQSSMADGWRAVVEPGARGQVLGARCQVPCAVPRQEGRQHRQANIGRQTIDGERRVGREKGAGAAPSGLAPSLLKLHPRANQPARTRMRSVFREGSGMPCQSTTPLTCQHRPSVSITRTRLLRRRPHWMCCPQRDLMACLDTAHGAGGEA